MFRAKGFTPQTKTVNFMLLDGGAGDHIASLPAIQYVTREYPWIKPLVWVPDYMLELAKHLIPTGATIRSLSQMRGVYEPKRPTKTTKWDGVTSPMKMHGVDYAFLKLLDEVPPTRDYLQIRPYEIDIKSFALPSKYVVLTTGFTAAVREWPAIEINKTAKYLIGRNITPVFLGQKNTNTGTTHTIQGEFKAGVNYSVGLDLIDKTSLLQAAAIMHKAEAVLGVDNGLLHLAGCTQTPIVGGFTTVNPELRMPARKGILGYAYYAVVPDTALKCQFCQVKTNFLYGHDYKNCVYKDNLCTTQMTADKFIKHLENIL